MALPLHESIGWLDYARADGQAPCICDQTAQGGGKTGLA
ncbi:hypothetical protein GJA_1298 [Janthinobacterium agaricidamnosum NBRC 102515 = DSM 9628]|uniref:Uncharacterized protein n=1 Tax=Janthinobacterium agaricidamnosum NBRC 102515 = DSM 9628 TaxID=1349767 RepID=W0V273_9BURK|nr:hypothetical protein GJA_1298 [Janthinobacterium agaricidamnosum NBRC 102515 = DSM 9628]